MTSYYVPKLAYSTNVTHLKVCTCSSPKEYLFLGRSISSTLGRRLLLRKLLMLAARLAIKHFRSSLTNVSLIFIFK